MLAWHAPPAIHVKLDESAMLREQVTLKTSMDTLLLQLYHVINWKYQYEVVDGEIKGNLN